MDIFFLLQYVFFVLMLKYKNVYDGLLQDIQKNIYLYFFIVLYDFQQFVIFQRRIFGQGQVSGNNFSRIVFFFWKILVKCFVFWRVFFKERRFSLCIWRFWFSRNQRGGFGLGDLFVCVGFLYYVGGFRICSWNGRCVLLVYVSFFGYFFLFIWK